MASWTSNVKSLIADPTQEAWAALAISIIKCVDADRAFEMLSGLNLNNKNRKWTDKDIDDIEAMKAQGMTNRQIAEVYGTTKTNIAKVYERAKKRGKTK